MDCPKFIPNIFNNTKCSQCFKIQEEHTYYRSSLNNSDNNTFRNNNRISIAESDHSDGKTRKDNSISGKIEREILKCGHLFIAPSDYIPDDQHFKNKRWQRRWFVLYGSGELTYSIDDHPEAIPQGRLNLNEINEITSGEEVTGHQHSITLLASDGTIYYLKGSTGDEYKKWIHLFAKFCSNTVAVLIGSPLRRSSSSCASTTSCTTTTDEFQRRINRDQENVVAKALEKFQDAKFKQTPPAPSPRRRVTTEKVVYIDPTSNSFNSNPVKKEINSSNQSSINTGKKSSTQLLRGDPDGGEREFLEKSHAVDCWITSESSTTTISSSSPKITEDINSKLKILKSQLASKRTELEALNKNYILKSDKLFVDNLKLQLNSYFIEIDKLNHLITYRYNDLKEALKLKENEMVQLNDKIQEAMVTATHNNFLVEENKLLVDRINDLTEKYYNLDKNYKIMKTKLHRYRTNSLKDKDLVENEIYTKIKDLESKIDQYLPPDPSSKPTNTPIEDKRSLINVVLKLNELEKRLDAGGPPTEWYKCSNCDYLQTEIFNRDTKLNELENMVNTLETTISFVNNLTIKYNQEINELRTFYSETLQSFEVVYQGLVGELEQKQRIHIEEIQMNKEKEMEEETRATKNALDLLKKNYELELQNERTQLRQEYLLKYSDNNTLIETLHLSHEEEVRDLRRQILDLTDKYTKKCLDYAQLEEKCRYQC